MRILIYLGVMEFRTLPQNMAPWDTDYFKLKEFTKWHVKEELFDLPLKQVIRPSYERCPPYTQRKRASIS